MGSRPTRSDLRRFMLQKLLSGVPYVAWILFALSAKFALGVALGGIHASLGERMAFALSPLLWLVLGSGLVLWLTRRPSSEEVSILIDNRTDATLTVEVLGVPDDHELRRVTIAPQGAHRCRIDPVKIMAESVGSGAVAHDEAGRLIARLEEPLRVRQRWIIEANGMHRYIGYLAPM
ncbi:hypothetical protein Cs7R123_15080 [Catellatospora sp. TT07R-123]|uniref:hypothetical protein n=1 Tax=Catellatospora sp. TT07R-123 TaxID=2733863 RepID=UPI001B1A097F|nr:hypothetical protein [Catellatospora sp. TT07R-123]GHJ44166.1 hypothetical protein Cs7R123_15080 [Catellatospora sp. TT07R-123]